MSESMTGIIYYCDACTLRIPDADQKDGSAGPGPNGKMLCAKCSAKSVPASAAAPRRKDTPPSPPAMHAPPAPPPPVAFPTPIRMARPQPKVVAPAKKQRLPVELIAGGVVFMGVVTLAVGLAMRGSKNTDTVSVASPSRKEEPPKKPEATTAKPVAPAVPAVPQPAPAKIPQASPPPANVPQPQPSPPAAAPVPAPAQPATATPVAPPAAAPADFDPRADYANHLLTQAKEFIAKNPEEVFEYKEKLEKLRDNYRTLAPGKEAAQLLSELKLPAVDPALDPPLPAEDDWSKATQVISAADPSKDPHTGNWTKSNTGVRSDKGGAWAKYTLPYLLPDEYDVRITFTRTENEDCLVVNLAHKGRAICFSIGGAGNTGISLEEIAPKKKYMLPVKLSRGGIFPSQQRTTVIVQVREKIARAFLNGKPTVGCVMDDATVTPKPDMGPPNPRQMGLLTWLSTYDIHAIEVIEIKGKGEFTK
jgi:hypothetical protein